MYPPPKNKNFSLRLHFNTMTYFCWHTVRPPSLICHVPERSWPHPPQTPADVCLLGQLEASVLLIPLVYPPHLFPIIHNN